MIRTWNCFSWFWLLPFFLFQWRKQQLKGQKQQQNEQQLRDLQELWGVSTATPTITTAGTLMRVPLGPGRPAPALTTASSRPWPTQRMARNIALMSALKHFGSVPKMEVNASILYALSAQTKFNSVFLKITIFQMITVTGEEMVVTRRRTRWMRTVLQSRTTRFAAATPTCKLHGSYSRRPVLTLHCSRFQV